MHNRFEAALRREMLTSLILEVKIRELEDAVLGGIVPNLGTLLADPIQ